jgi:uncharacterized membrane protein
LPAMTDTNPDFEKFVGPDKRSIPHLRGLSLVIIVIASLVLGGMVALWPRGELVVDLGVIGFADDSVPAEVVSVEPQGCSYAPQVSCYAVEFVVSSGEHLGTIVPIEFVDEPGQPNLEVGDGVFLSVVAFEDGPVTFQYADRDRGMLIWVLTLTFAAAVIALGRMRGIAALLGLVVSIGVLLGFILPAIIAGRDAVLVALVGGGAIALVSLYLAHGYNPLTHAAALGTFAALLLTVILSWVVVAVASFSGLTGEEAFFLVALPDVNLNGLILAGITLGALGALDDVTVTQASAVWEVHGANPDLGADHLYLAGMRVGRDHIVSTVNTLLLAYAGASLPLLILFSLSNQSMGIVASSEVISVEIVRTLVGSMGLVASVPITTWLSARIAATAVGAR